MGSLKQQAVIIYDAPNSEYFQKLLSHTGLPVAKDMIFHNQIATQIYKSVDRCSEKCSKRGRVDDDKNCIEIFFFLELLNHRNVQMKSNQEKDLLVQFPSTRNP